MNRTDENEWLSLPLKMWMIRAFEEKGSKLFARRQVLGLLHLGIRQEAVAVGVCSRLRPEGYIFGTHRSHGHAIAKEANLARPLAELAGRSTGYSLGKDGSMHIVAWMSALERPREWSAGTIPLALAAALVCKGSIKFLRGWFKSSRTDQILAKISRSYLFYSAICPTVSVFC